MWWLLKGRAIGIVIFVYLLICLSIYLSTSDLAGMLKLKMRTLIVTNFPFRR
jgi:hypothetical protein